MTVKYVVDRCILNTTRVLPKPYSLGPIGPIGSMQPGLQNVQ